MCIIVYAPKDVEVEKTTLRNCFDNNSDGAGIMYQKNDNVVISKGYMTFASFWEAWEKIPVRFDRVAHFRIATSGKITEGVCHPFPICKNYNEMKKTKQVTPLAIAHNGILSRYSPTAAMKSEYSDTMAFVKLTLSPLRSLLFMDAVQNLISETGSKFAIMSGNQVSLIGNFEQSGGAFFSNTTYKYGRAVYTKTDWKSYRSKKTTYQKLVDMEGLYDIWVFDDVPSDMTEIDFIRDLEKHNSLLYLEPEFVKKINPTQMCVLYGEEDLSIECTYPARIAEPKDMASGEFRAFIDALYDQVFGDEEVDEDKLTDDEWLDRYGMRGYA
jgi:predicted glutamine amidotransferase